MHTTMEMNRFWNYKWKWSSRSFKLQINRDLNSGEMHLWTKFGNWNCDDLSSGQTQKWGIFWLWSSIWPWRSRSITPKNNRDLNQGLLQLWSKFGAPSLNGWWVIVWTSSWLTHTQTDGRTHTQTDAGNDNTRRPKLASGKNPHFTPPRCWYCFKINSCWPIVMSSIHGPVASSQIAGFPK